MSSFVELCVWYYGVSTALHVKHGVHCAAVHEWCKRMHDAQCGGASRCTNAPIAIGIVIISAVARSLLSTHWLSSTLYIAYVSFIYTISSTPSSLCLMHRSVVDQIHCGWIFRLPITNNSDVLVVPGWDCPPLGVFRHFRYRRRRRQYFYV